MRPWVRRAAQAALLTASFAAGSAGVSGVALCGTSMASPWQGNRTESSNSTAVSPCGSAAAVLGDPVAGCEDMGAAYPGGTVSGPGLRTRSAQPAHTEPGPSVRAQPAPAVLPRSSLPPAASLPTFSLRSAIGAIPRRKPAATLAAGAIPGLEGFRVATAPQTLTSFPIGVTAAVQPLPGTLLHADTSRGTGARSLLCLAAGALMAGAAALTVAGRRTYDVRR